MTEDTRASHVELSVDHQVEYRYNPMDARNLLRDEITQRRETWYDVDDVVTAANNTDAWSPMPRSWVRECRSSS